MLIAASVLFAVRPAHAAPLGIDLAVKDVSVYQSRAVSQPLGATGGLAPYTFKTILAPPSGLSVSTDGVLSGTTLVAIGIYAFQVEVTDARGDSASVYGQIMVNGASITLGSIAASAQVDRWYSDQITASGGSGPYTFTVRSGAAPDGVTVAADGTIEGHPKSSGSYTFAVFATDVHGFTGWRQYTLVVAEAPEIVVAGLSLTAQEGEPYTSSVTATGGTAPYEYALAGGTQLPAGLALNQSSGAVTGTPTKAGRFTFDIMAQDADTFAGVARFTLVVAPADTSTGPGRPSPDGPSSDPGRPPTDDTSSGTPQAGSGSPSGTTSGTGKPGSRMMATLSGFAPLSEVDVWLHSTPVHLGMFTADTNGTVTVTFDVPSGFAGAHTVEGVGKDANGNPLSVSAAFTVPPAETLPFTGAPAGLHAVAGFTLLAAGAALLATARRRAVLAKAQTIMHGL